MRDDDFIGQKFHWFSGEIVDINDGKHLNRVKVKCHGYHPDTIDTADLPWATVMMPVTSAGTPNVGANHHLEKGSWVIGFFRDGASAQDPIVMGSITTSTDDIYDLHHSASTTNKIYHSKAGHLIEIENGTFTDAIEAVAPVAAQPATGEGDFAFPAVDAVEEVIGVPASQSGDYLRVTHRGGTKIEIDDDNNLTIYVEDGGDLGITVKKGNTTIKTQEGDTTIATSDKTIISSTGNTTLVAGGKTDIVSGEEITITSAVSTTIV